jgi:hypothetical protein
MLCQRRQVGKGLGDAIRDTEHQRLVSMGAQQRWWRRLDGRDQGQTPRLGRWTSSRRLFLVGATQSLFGDMPSVHSRSAIRLRRHGDSITVGAE